MTQEEKARAYDEAIKRVKAILKVTDNIRESLLYVSTIFPELKESEDEESKKWILEYLYDGMQMSDEQSKGQFKSAISWLEKQGEQPQGKSSVEAIKKERKRKYRQRDDSTKQKISQSLKGRSKSFSHVENIRQGLKRYWSQIPNKPINDIDPE